MSTVAPSISIPPKREKPADVSVCRYKKGGVGSDKKQPSHPHSEGRCVLSVYSRVKDPGLLSPMCNTAAETNKKPQYAFSNQGSVRAHVSITFNPPTHQVIEKRKKRYPMFSPISTTSPPQSSLFVKWRRSCDGQDRLLSLFSLVSKVCPRPGIVS